MKIKEIQWTKIKHLSGISVRGDAPLTEGVDIYIGKEDCYISLTISHYWGEHYSGNLTLDTSYTEDELKVFAQDMYEHFILTKAFDGPYQ